MTLVPEDEPGCIEKCGDGKVPANTMDDASFGNIKPLGNNKSTEKDVNCDHT